MALRSQINRFQDAPTAAPRDRLIEIVIKDLRAEDDLNAEIEIMLGKYEKEFERGALDRRKMFNLINRVVSREISDGTYTPRRRDIADLSFGKKVPKVA